MSSSVQFQCLNCGHRFEAEILTEDEVRELERRQRRAGVVQCPVCNRTDIRRGW